MKYKTKLEIDLEVILEDIKNNSTGNSVEFDLVKHHLEESLKHYIKGLIEGENLRYFNASKDTSKVESVQYISKVTCV